MKTVLSFSWGGRNKGKKDGLREEACEIGALKKINSRTSSVSHVMLVKWNYTFPL